MRYILSFILLFNLSFTAVGAEGAKSQHGMSETKSRRPLDLKHKAQLVAVLEANEKLHSAFFKYNGRKIEIEAKEVVRSIGKLKHKKAMEILIPAKKLLLSLKAKSKKEQNNVAYHKASLLLASIVNKYDVGNSYNVYSCPMVKKTWIQNSKKQLRTHNPYAPEMPHCGGRDTEY